MLFYHQMWYNIRIPYSIGPQYHHWRIAMRQTAVMRNAKLLRTMAAEGKSFSEIARAIGTNKRYVRAYILQHQIPYTPYAPTLERNGRWKGGRIIDQDGYILTKSPDHPSRDRHNYVREHRLVAEQILGRYLQPQEVVHHKDGDKQNNNPDNLEVFGTNAEHLAQTLQGHRPNWTPEGWARMKAPRQRRANPPQSTTPDS
jgi:hypothetical protein